MKDQIARLIVGEFPCLRAAIEGAFGHVSIKIHCLIMVFRN